MNLGDLRGQSAIEYLMTYGWMLLVVALAGGAIFSMFGEQYLETVSGFTGEDVLIEDFGLTSDENLELILRNGGNNNVNVKSISIGGVEHEINEDIAVGSTSNVTLPHFEDSETAMAHSVEIEYDSGELEGLLSSGTLSTSIDQSFGVINYGLTDESLKLKLSSGNDLQNVDVCAYKYGDIQNCASVYEISSNQAESVNLFQLEQTGKETEFELIAESNNKESDLTINKSFEFYEVQENDFQEKPSKEFVRNLHPRMVREVYEPEGWTDVLEVGSTNEYTSIQDAVDAAESGDTVIVEEGTYHEETIFIDENIYLIGEAGAALNGYDSPDSNAFKIGFDASPVIKGFNIIGFDSRAVEIEDEAEGDWVAADLRIIMDGDNRAFGAEDTKGDWMILDTRMQSDGTHYTNINAPRAEGNVTMDRIYIRNGFYPVNLNSAEGNITIRNSNIGGARGVYYSNEVDKEDTVIKIRNSYFTGNYQGAITANDEAPEVDARENYWNEDDLESVEDENVDASNPLSSRPELVPDW